MNIQFVIPVAPREKEYGAIGSVEVVIGEIDD